MEEESCSDHNILRYNLTLNPNNELLYNSQGPGFIIKEDQHTDFQRNFRRLEQDFQIDNNGRNTTEIDEKLAEIITIQEDRDTLIDRIDDTIKTCIETIKQYTSQTKHITGKSVPWWSTELTIMRKRTNAPRRRYQRTQQNEQLWTSRKNQYIEEKKKYQTAIRREKTKSWKLHCTITTPNNPWNEVYRLAAGKTRATLTLTTLLKPDGSRTRNIGETLKTMMDSLIPEDSAHDDTKQHAITRSLANQPLDTPKDQEFTQN
jgi:hypothetical protein